MVNPVDSIEVKGTGVGFRLGEAETGEGSVGLLGMSREMGTEGFFANSSRFEHEFDLIGFNVGNGG